MDRSQRTLWSPLSDNMRDCHRWPRTVLYHRTIAAGGDW